MATLCALFPEVATAILLIALAFVDDAVLSEAAAVVTPVPISTAPEKAEENALEPSPSMSCVTAVVAVAGEAIARL